MWPAYKDGMPRFLQRLRLGCLRHWMVWVLLLALPVHGVSNVLLQVVGATHRHALTMQAPATDDLTGRGAAASGATAWDTRGALRRLVASVAGPGALQLIDAMHARDHAWQRAAALKAHPFSEPARSAALLTQPTANLHAAKHAHQQAHQHAHDTFQRHLHDPQDGSVVALGGHGQPPDAAGSAPALDAGGSTFPLAPALSVQALAPSGTANAWRPAETSDWHSHVTPPLERPPQA